MEHSLLVIFFAAVFTENILLARFLGMCSFLSLSREVRTALGLGTAVTVVLACTALLNCLVDRWLLVPLGLEYLRLIVFIVVIAAFVQLLELALERLSPPLYYALGIFLPLITVNCAILGVALFQTIRGYGPWQCLAYGAGSGLGWLLAILGLAGLRLKLQQARIPRGLEGPGIALILAGLMALAFVGLSGVLSGQ